MKRSTPMKRSRMRHNPPVKGSVRDLERTLDDLTRQIVLLQEKKCFTCPATSGLQCGHLFTRTWRSVRWEVEGLGPVGANCHAQCSLCNKTHEGVPQIYESAYIDKYGWDAYDDLDRRAHSKHKFTYSELLDMIAEREALLVSLGGQE